MEHPLAGQSSQFTGGARLPESGKTIGEYFLAAQTFIATPEVAAGLAGILGTDGPSPPDWDVVLDLQKHGAFYHPIKMSIFSAEMAERQSFALNGAVSPHGRELARTEGRLFSWLEGRMPATVTPEVLAAGEVDQEGEPVGFLMVRWLEGFYEFHLTGSGDQVVVWRPDQADLYLPLKDVLPAYENIARILTLAYDLDSGNQVLLWHHAAGDFILAPDSPDLPVRLITVRALGSLAGDEILARGPMPGLLLFFINLCLRMQMDRLDGVGEPVLLGPDVLRATLKGFLKGLAHVAGDEAAQRVWDFLSGFPADQVELILEQVMAAWPPGPSEKAFILAKMPFFARQIRALLKSGRFSDFY